MTEVTITLTQNQVSAARQIALAAKRGASKDMDGKELIEYIIASELAKRYESTVANSAERAAEIKFEATTESCNAVGIEFPMTKREFVQQATAKTAELLEELQDAVEIYKR